MTRFYTLTLGTLFAVSALACIHGCAADGSFASKTKPVDLKVSLARVCVGVAGLEAAYDGLEMSKSGLIKPEWHDKAQAAKKFAGDVCDPTKPPTDIATVLAQLAVYAVDMGDIVGALSAR
jgi:hypothetical protein